MITSDLRRAIARALAAAGLEAADPGLRPTGVPGQYASSVAFAVCEPPRACAARLAASLAGFAGIARADVTGPGFITVTVTPEALAGLPARIAAAGRACAASGALRGQSVAAPPPGDPLAAATWDEARTVLAAQVTARLAAAAGAMAAVPADPERGRGAVPPAPALPPGTARGQQTGVAAAVAFAGADAVRFTLARAVPGRPLRADPRAIARHVPGNPAYAVRYAHARAASGVRWAVTSAAAVVTPQRPPADPGELALLDALSWLPERVATAARRGRPDEFARYLEGLASATIAALIPARDPGSAGAPGTGRLAMAGAARTGLAAGLGLLGVSAPDRLLPEELVGNRSESCCPPSRPAPWGRAARRPSADTTSRPERAASGDLAAQCPAEWRRADARRYRRP